MTIDKFDFDGIAGDFKLVEGVDRFGDNWRHKRRDLAEGLTLYVYDSGQAALEFPEHVALEFLYSDEVAEVFSEIKNVTALELFEVINRNRL